MKFTSLIRQSIIKAVMADVPQIDYMEQTRTHTNKQAAVLRKKAGLPAGVEDRLRGTYVFALSSYFNVAGITEDECKAISESREIKVLREAHEAQQVKIVDLRKSIYSAMYSVNTLKQAMEAFPEFEKYYPKEHITVRSLPTLTNVVSDFVKAGWPIKKTKEIV